MILQALTDYYRRKRESEPGSLPDIGFEFRPIDFAIVISTAGRFSGLIDLRDPQGKRLVGRTALAPLAPERSSRPRANLLVDNASYVLGLGNKGEAKRSLFVTEIEELDDEVGGDAGTRAVLRFFREREFDKAAEALNKAPNSPGERAVLAFRLEAEADFVSERPALRSAISARRKPFLSVDTIDAQQSGVIGHCMVTGASDCIAEVHRSFGPGMVRNANTTGSKIVSFTPPAFDSYQKKQGGNAPVSVPAAFAYAAALNHLLRWGSEQRLVVADATLVFWAEEQTEMESLFVQALTDDPDRRTAAVKAIYDAYHKGAPARPDDQRRFYVLGLAPNAARLSVRLWQTATTRELGERIRQHFERLVIVHGENESDFLPIRWLLRNIAVGREEENIPPNLAGDTLRAILAGLPYPRSLLVAAVRRNRAEQMVNYPRAALIKACLSAQYERNDDKELTMSLDLENDNIGYRLGRLFFFLEQAQASAVNANRTLRERYFAVASTNPSAVFPRLLRMYTHNQAKLKDAHPALATRLDKGITEVISGLDDFPVTLRLEDQGRFAVGYYHQRQQWFTKREKQAQKDAAA